MDVISPLSKQLATAYPDISFQSGDTFEWSPTSKTVTFDPGDPNAAALLLHEVAHAVLGHSSYSRDVALVSMETDAWQHARTLSETYNIPINEQVVESHLDTYRAWLHQRSTCPSCVSTGLQVGAKHYRCLACTQEWQVNEARLCALRRYSLNKKAPV